MAGSIKGITIEIGGDTTKLGRALSNVDKSTRSLKNELSSVEKALQLDPTNTILLAQKQDILKDAISKTTEKLNILTTSQKSLEEKLTDGDIDEGQYRAFQRELINTQSEFDGLQNILTQTEEDIAKVNNNLENTNITLENTGIDLENTSSKFDLLGENASDFNTKMSNALNSVISQVVDLGIKAIETSEQFNDAYDIIIKKTGATGENLESFKESANNVYSELPTSLEDSATAVGEVNTKFALTGEELEEVSKMFIQFATINDTDVNNSIDTISQLMKQWNLNMENLPGLLGLITSNAQATGISVDSLISGMCELPIV